MKKIIYTAMMLGVVFDTFAMKRSANLSHADGACLRVAGVRAESSTEADRILAQLHNVREYGPQTLEKLKTTITSQLHRGQIVKLALLRNGKTDEAKALEERIRAFKQLRDISLAQRNSGNISYMRGLVDSMMSLQAQVEDYQQKLDQERVSEALDVMEHSETRRPNKMRIRSADEERVVVPSRPVSPSSSYALVAHKEKQSSRALVARGGASTGMSSRALVAREVASTGTSSSDFGARKRPSVSTSSSTTSESTAKEAEIQQVQHEILEMQRAISSKIERAEAYRGYAEQLNNAYLGLLDQASNMGLDLGLQSVQDINLGYRQWDNQIAKVKTTLNAGVLRTTQVELLWGQYMTVQAQLRMIDEYLAQVKQDVIGYQEACQGASRRLWKYAAETTGAANAQVQQEGGTWLRQTQEEESKGFFEGLLDGVKNLFGW